MIPFSSLAQIEDFLERDSHALFLSHYVFDILGFHWAKYKKPIGRLINELINQDNLQPQLVWPGTK